MDMDSSTYLPINIFEEFDILSQSRAPKSIVYDSEIYELVVRPYKFPYLYGDETMLEMGYYSVGVDEDGDHYFLWYVTGKTVEECDKQIFEGLNKWKIEY